MVIWIFKALITSKTCITGEGIIYRVWLDNMLLEISSSKKESYPNATHYP